jgi:hypothetical protein
LTPPISGRGQRIHISSRASRNYREPRSNAASTTVKINNRVPRPGMGCRNVDWRLDGPAAVESKRSAVSICGIVWLVHEHHSRLRREVHADTFSALEVMGRMQISHGLDPVRQYGCRSLPASGLQGLWGRCYDNRSRWRKPARPYVKPYCPNLDHVRYGFQICGGTDGVTQKLLARLGF